MSVILLPGRRLEQPQQPVALDHGNPLLRDADVVALPASGWRNMVSQQPGPPGAYGSLHTLNGFKSTSFAAATSGRVPVVRRAYSARTVLVVYAQASADLYSGVFTGITPSNSTSNERIANEIGGNNQWFIHGPTWNSGAVVGRWSTGWDTLNGRRAMLVRWAGAEDGGLASLFLDGRAIPRTSGTAQTGLSDLTQSTAPAAVHFGPNAWYSTDIVTGLWIHWGRYVSDGEARALTENPWQVFRPVQRRVWIGTDRPSVTPIVPAAPGVDAAISDGALSTEGALTPEVLVGVVRIASGALGTESLATPENVMARASVADGALATGATALPSSPRASVYLSDGAISTDVALTADSIPVRGRMMDGGLATVSSLPPAVVRSDVAITDGLASTDDSLSGDSVRARGRIADGELITQVVVAPAGGSAVVQIQSAVLFTGTAITPESVRAGTRMQDGSIFFSGQATVDPEPALVVAVVRAGSLRPDEGYRACRPVVVSGRRFVVVPRGRSMSFRR